VERSHVRRGLLRSAVTSPALTAGQGHARARVVVLSAALTGAVPLPLFIVLTRQRCIPRRHLKAFGKI
jgi:hypothetical protein